MLPLSLLAAVVVVWCPLAAVVAIATGGVGGAPLLLSLLLVVMVWCPPAIIVHC